MNSRKMFYQLIAVVCVYTAVGASTQQVAPTTTPPTMAPEDSIPNTTAPEGAQTSLLFPDLRGDKFEEALHEYAKAGHRNLGYRRAREVLYWMLDNKSGIITTVYALHPVRLEPGVWADSAVMNCEHVWPQSKGKRTAIEKADLFHLRPAVPRVNSIRSNLPYGVPQPPYDHDKTYKQGRDQHGQEVFLPPPNVRGDLARSSFYYAVRYKMDIDPIQESHLREWHRKDPVDQQERDRAQVITEEQGNANPFIDDPAAVDRIVDF